MIEEPACDYATATGHCVVGVLTGVDDVAADCLRAELRVLPDLKTVAPLR